MTQHNMHFTSSPSTLKAYTKLLKPRPGLNPGEQLPELAASLHEVLPSYPDVRAYEDICGLPHALGSESQQLPLIYPQIIAAPLHMQLLSHPDFPITSAGLVHLRNSITQHHTLPLYDRLTVTAKLGECREVEAGIEFDILTTTIDSSDKLLWEATTTILEKSSSKSSKSNGKKRERVPFASSISAPDQSMILKVPASQGRRYAAICKDFNPIHLHPVTAKLFGFPRAIAHGMWVLGRSLAEVIDFVPSSPCTLNVSFKRPVYLPSSVLLTAKHHENHSELAVTTTDGAIPHLVASIHKEV